ncbi:MAG: hypothetical protein HC875_26090 [Anaerolineales bacterium]|nr:hypothetical protein [Anaerolineales bacterium]
MYALNYPGGGITSKLCQLNDIRYGCVYRAGGDGPIPGVYPFGSNNTPTISIEIGTQGYLRNVVPNELDPGHAASSVRAQAIAARTYAYRQILDTPGGILNNSATNFQTYIPYSYDTLSTSYKAVIDQAVSGQVYLSLPGSTDPIAAFFGQDNDLWTTGRSQSYLKSIYDPISRAEGHDVGTSNGGMGQKAAGRWGAGRTGEYPEHGSQWTVRWDTAQQILAHYYTGINFIGLSPDPPDDYRFNILDVPGLPGTLYMRPGESITDLAVYFQNSGNSDWPVIPVYPGGSCPQAGHRTYLSYHLYNASNSSAVAFAIQKYGLCQANSGALTRGNYAWISNVSLKIPHGTPPGTYKLRLDVQIDGRWLSGLQGTNHWPTQDIEVVVDPGGMGGEPEVSINHPPAVFTTEVWRRYGQRFGFSWTPVNGANYFDFRYRSRVFHSAKPWNAIGWKEELDNVQFTSVYDSVNCDRNRREYQFQVRGQLGPDGDESEWKTTYTKLKVLPFLSISNVTQGYATFFEVDPPSQMHTANLYVTNEGGGTLQWQATHNQPAWINLSPTSGTDDEIVTLTITKPGGLGTYTGQLTFTVTGSNPAACNDSVPINITAFVLEHVEKGYLPIILKGAVP